MKILTNAKEIRGFLSTLRPSKVAVAFVGAGWKNYISSDRLEEMVLSPTLGSNPKAIEEIMAALGEDNVHFLDRLHSKFYLGDSAALLGSNNLSDNGLADAGLIEAAVWLEETDALQKLEATLANYKELAKRLYPNAQAKKERLRVLLMEWNTAFSYGHVSSSFNVPKVAGYKSGLDRIHIAWYGSNDVEFDAEKINAAIPQANGSPDDYFSDFLQFHEEDNVLPGDWILCWHCRNDGYPRKSGGISWMYAHHVIPRGFVDDNYTKLVGEAKHLKCPPVPFELDSSTKHLIRDMLGSGDFPELLSLDETPWHLSPADAVTPRFLALLSDLAKNK